MHSIWNDFVLVTTPILAAIWLFLMWRQAKLRNSGPRFIYPPPPRFDFLDDEKDAKMSEKVDWSKEGF